MDIGQGEPPPQTLCVEFPSHNSPSITHSQFKSPAGILLSTDITCLYYPFNAPIFNPEKACENPDGFGATIKRWIYAYII
jgi:hypothetical protein